MCESCFLSELACFHIIPTLNQTLMKQGESIPAMETAWMTTATSARRERNCWIPSITSIDGSQGGETVTAGPGMDLDGTELLSSPEARRTSAGRSLEAIALDRPAASAGWLSGSRHDSLPTASSPGRLITS